MATELQIIQVLVKSLDRSTDNNGIQALDKAIRACSGYRSTQDLINEFTARCYAMRGEKNTTTLNNFLKYTCGINLYNDDTGAITGSDAGGSTVKTAESIVPENNTSLQIGSNGIFRLNNTNVIVKLPAYRNESEHAVLNGLCTWWVAESVRLINESYGLYFNKRTDSTDSQIPYISFGFDYNSNNNTLASCRPSYYGEKAYAIHVSINMAKYPDLTLYKNGNFSGYTSKNSSLLDRTIAHELTHALFMTSLKRSIFQTLPQFFTEGIAELVHGIDDFRRGTILDVISDPSRLSDALTLKRGTGETDAYAAGYLLLRYLAHQVSIGAKPPIIAGLNHSADNTILTATTAYNGTSINTYNAKVQTIDARKAKRAVSIIGNDNNNFIFANNKGDFLRGGYGNDTLYGGTGVDTFFSFGVEGNDTIYNYQSGKDIIRFGSAKYGALTSATVEGSDVVLKVGTGSVTIKDGAGKYIKIMDGNNNVSYNRFVKGTAKYDSDIAHFFSSGDNDEAYTLYQSAVLGLVYNSNKTTLTAQKNCAWDDINTNEFWWTLKSVNLAASSHGHTVIGRESITSMTGSKYDDKLIAGGRTAVLKGGAGNDLLRGASVNSKLYGGTGNDEIYSESGTNYLYGEAGDDIMGCLKGKSYLYGGAGNDQMLGGEGTNLLDGGNGDDILIGGKGINTINGGNGNDQMKGGEGTNTINKLNGGNGNDTMYGGEGTNTLHGGNGNDNLTGGSGKNLLYGDAGNDTITGGSGLSKLYGGAGNDILTGGIDVNELYGGAGNDELHGGKDANGTYLLKGEAGNDTIIGGAGSNTIWGGAGKDTLTGGTGKNTYYFASLGEMAGDTITNLKGSDVLYFNLKKAALDLDAIYQNYNLGQTTGKNTISLEGETLTITDKNKRKYTMTIAGGFSGSMTLQNHSGQSQIFNFNN